MLARYLFNSDNLAGVVWTATEGDNPERVGSLPLPEAFTADSAQTVELTATFSRNVTVRSVALAGLRTPGATWELRSAGTIRASAVEPNREGNVLLEVGASPPAATVWTIRGTAPSGFMIPWTVGLIVLASRRLRTIPGPGPYNRSRLVAQQQSPAQTGTPILSPPENRRWAVSMGWTAYHEDRDEAYFEIMRFLAVLEDRRNLAVMKPIEHDPDLMALRLSPDLYDENIDGNPRAISAQFLTDPIDRAYPREVSTNLVPSPPRNLLFTPGTSTTRGRLTWDVSLSDGSSPVTRHVLQRRVSGGQFQTIEFAPGRLLILDRSDRELYQVNPDGADAEGVKLRDLPAGIEAPQGMAILNNRALIVDSTGTPNDELYSADPDGPSDSANLLRVLPTGVLFPHGIIVYNDRVLIIDNDGDEVWEVDPEGGSTEGTILRSLPAGLTTPTGIAVYQGRLLVVDNAGDELYEIDPDGADDQGTRLRALPTGLTSPQAMTVYRGRLLITDDAGDELYEIDPDGADDQGTRLRALPTGLTLPQGMAWLSIPDLTREYHDLGLTPGETYEWRVLSRNAIGDSNPSNVVSYTVPSP